MGRMAPELDLAWLDPSLRGLTRRDASGLGSGLCRAIAERIGVDPVLVRVALIVLILSGGLGIGLYAWGTVLTRGPSGTRWRLRIAFATTSAIRRPTSPGKYSDGSSARSGSVTTMCRSGA